MANDKTIIRTRKNRENPYVMLNKTSLQDDRLSWKAKGLHAYLMSLPDDWIIYIQELTKHTKDGRDATRAAFKELELAGYITNEAIRDKKGRIEKWEKIVYEQPLHWDEFEMPKSKKKKASKPETENPDLDKKAEKPEPENPHLDNPTLLNNNLTNNDLTNNLNNNNKKKKNNKKKDTKSTDSPSKSKDVGTPTPSVVVVSERIKSFLSKKKLKINGSTLNKWVQLANEETIIAAIEYTLHKNGVKTIAGYVTRILQAGFTPDLSTDYKNDLPEWISRKEVAVATSELTPEQKKQAEELLKQLDKIK